MMKVKNNLAWTIFTIFVYLVANASGFEYSFFNETNSTYGNSSSTIFEGKFNSILFSLVRTIFNWKGVWFYCQIELSCQFFCRNSMQSWKHQCHKPLCQWTSNNRIRRRSNVPIWLTTIKTIPWMFRFSSKWNVQLQYHSNKWH